MNELLPSQFLELASFVGLISYWIVFSLWTVWLDRSPRKLKF